MPDGGVPPLFGLSQRLPPSNIQAEQALLGALLANNKAYERVSEFLAPDHFADPIHGRVYQSIVRRIEAGQLADALMLKVEFENSGILEEVGGTPYLAQLLTAMVGIINAGEYGRAVHDAWLRRQLINIGETMVNNAFGAATDLTGSQQIEAAEQVLADLAGGEATSEDAPVTVSDAMRAAVQEGECARSGQGEARVSTGLPSLDRRILGLRPGHLVVAAGRPGMGKTALARTLALNVAGGRGVTGDGEILDDQRRGAAVAYFSLEETAADFGAACVAQLANVTIRQVLDGDLSIPDGIRVAMAQKRVAGMPLMVFDQPRQSLRQITRQARRVKRQHKRLGLVIVDYLQIMADAPGAKDKRLAVGQNAYGLKALAKELGCPVLLLSQLSRAVENRTDRRPNMSDLRESGEIEDAADAIILLYREEYYYRQTGPKVEADGLPSATAAARQAWQDGLQKIAGKAEAIIPKVRRGEPGTVDLHFVGPFLRFEEPR